MVVRSKCQYPRCFNQRPCPKHGSTDNRPSASRRGYDRHWQAYRLGYLQANPLCIQCEKAGRLTPATDVDHIKPISGQQDDLFWDSANHQALCHAHHSRKTASEHRTVG